MRRPGPEAGMTLVELLVVVAISGLIMPVLAGAFLVGWRTTDATVTSLSDSRNRQVAPSLFTRDVQQANTVDTSSADPTCTTAGDTLLVRMRWTETDATGSATNRAVAWVLTTGTERLVERRYCADGTTLTGSVTGTHGAVGTPTVTCKSATGSTVACGSAVSVDLSVTDSSGAFTATGRRRTA